MSRETEKKRIENLEKTLAEINEKLDRILQSSKKMDNHITFVEKLYEMLRLPLDFVKTNIEKFALQQPIPESLPKIPNEIFPKIQNEI